MVKTPKTKAAKPRRKSESGLTGGPSTIRGVTYQVDHAVYLLLEQIWQVLADPFTPRFITTEPRIVAPKVMRWDIRTDPPETTVEAKFNPQREELVQWLKLVRQASDGEPTRRFRFVYAEERQAAKLINTVKALIRIAIETDGNKEAFDKLVTHELVSGAEEVISLLGENAVSILQQIDLDQLSYHTLERNTQLRLSYLTTPEKLGELQKYLFEKIQRLAPSRITLSVKDIIDELRANEFKLNPPPVIDPHGLSPEVFAALSVLQNCKSGFPVEVLAAVIGISPEALTAQLASIREASLTGNRWSLAPLGARLAHPRETTLRAKALEEALLYVKRNDKSLHAQQQVANVIALAEACSTTYPRLVATVFGVLDKTLKEMGKKRLVHDVAMLSMTAAKPLAMTGDRDMKLAVIRSLICGLAWYFQRIGDLEEAHVVASKSLRYAEEVQSEVDLAYSAKCTGRLRRLEAEAVGIGANERQSKLAESIGMLTRAIQHFGDAEGHGLRGAEVGDCYSLMARTHLVAGEIAQARVKLMEAFARIPEDGGKDRIDLLILVGDVAVAAGDNEQALIQYDEAVTKAQSPGREVTEMRARALRQRGHLKQMTHDTTGAAADYEEAARIWGELAEPNFAAEVEFEMLGLSVKLPEHPRSLFMKEPPTVRVQAMKLHMEQLTEHNVNDTAVAGRRAKLPTEYWTNIIRRAHDLVGFEGI